MFRNVVNDFLRYGLRSISGMSRKILHPREAQRAFNYLRSGQNSAFLGMVVREGIAYSRRTGRPFSRNKVDGAFMGGEGGKKAFDRARARANRTRNGSSTEEAAAETIFVEKVQRIRKGRAFRPPRVLRLKRGRGGHLLENGGCNLSWREKRVGRIASALVNAPEVLRDVANARKDTTLAVKRLEAGTPHIDSALLSSSGLHSGIGQSFISTDSGWFGSLHFTVYRRKKRQKIISKTYTVHNFPLPVGYLMKNMLGKNGSGAGTIGWSHGIRGGLGRPTIASS